MLARSIIFLLCHCFSPECKHQAGCEALLEYLHCNVQIAMLGLLSTATWSLTYLLLHLLCPECAHRAVFKVFVQYPQTLRRVYDELAIFKANLSEQDANKVNLCLDIATLLGLVLATWNGFAATDASFYRSKLFEQWVCYFNGFLTVCQCIEM